MTAARGAGRQTTRPRTSRGPALARPSRTRWARPARRVRVWRQCGRRAAERARRGHRGPFRRVQTRRRQRREGRARGGGKLTGRRAAGRKLKGDGRRWMEGGAR